MAVRAFVAELPPVLILMATDTLRRQSKESVVEILDLHLSPNGNHDVLRIVAILAGQGFVFTDQREVCKGVMLEARLIKFCDLEGAAIVLEMTPGAVGLASRNVERASVIPMFLLDPPGDVGMAFQALEATLSESKVVAGGALRRAF
jgi:hypothetical protein